jgi:hypothetical protein
MTMFTPPATSTVAGCVADARSSAGDDAYLSQTHCVDWLLDCYNAAVRPSVRAVLVEKLTEFSHVNLLTATEFTGALDHVQLALQVDAAFDHLEIGT